jgi:hypothetical protein
MKYFCKAPRKNEKANNHLILFVHQQSLFDKVGQHLPKSFREPGSFQLVGSTAAPVITEKLEHCWPQGGFDGDGDGYGNTKYFTKPLLTIQLNS